MGNKCRAPQEKLCKSMKILHKGGLRELHNHHKDARGTKHWSPPRLHGWHMLENAYTKSFFWIFDENSSQSPRAHVNGPPPSKEKTWTPL